MAHKHKVRDALWGIVWGVVMLCIGFYFGNAIWMILGLVALIFGYQQWNRL